MSDELRAQTLPRESVGQRFQAWSQRLAASPAPRLPAELVYAGEHWQQSQRVLLRATASGWDAQLWIASAGQGLIASEHPISGYAATLAPRESDSVANTSDEARQWWHLTGSLQKSPTTPRQVTELVRRDPEAKYFLVLSGSYAAALVSDVEKPRTELLGPGELFVLSAGWLPPPTLQSAHLSFDASVQPSVGGARQSLNARVALWLLARIQPDNWSAETLLAELRQLMATAPEQEALARERMSDRELLAFIQAYAATELRPSASRALRHLRDTGRACEQRRFGQLYRNVQEAAYG